MYKADGSARPKPYILERLLAMDGLTPEEVIGLRFLDAEGGSAIYKKKDLAYRGDFLQAAGFLAVAGS